MSAAAAIAIIVALIVLIGLFIYGVRKSSDRPPYAAEGSSSIVQMRTTETGASAIFESSTLERAGRDLNAVVKRVAMSPQSYIVAGRLHLGLDAGAMRSEFALAS
jgi:hypothetical protein